eukprot:1451474-Pleurochrysis_carterae.AAC.1
MISSSKEEKRYHSRSQPVSRVFGQALSLCQPVSNDVTAAALTRRRPRCPQCTEPLPALPF